MTLHLRGGEVQGSRKRSYTDTAAAASPTRARSTSPVRSPSPGSVRARSVSPIAINNNNNNKRHASSTTIARAKAAVQHALKTGSKMVPTLSDVRALPHKTYASTRKRLQKVPVLLREQKRKVEQMPRAVLLKTVVLPALGVSSLLAFGGVIYLMGQSAFVIMVVQVWGFGSRGWSLWFRF